jgi:hypothetical protein
MREKGWRVTILGQALAKTNDPISKQTKAKKVGSMTQVMEHLPNKQKAQYHKKREVNVGH